MFFTPTRATEALKLQSSMSIPPNVVAALSTDRYRLVTFNRVNSHTECSSVQLFHSIYMYYMYMPSRIKSAITN